MRSVANLHTLILRQPILTIKNTQNYILSEISKYIPVTIATTCVQIIKYKIHFCATVGINLVNNNQCGHTVVTVDGSTQT